MTILSGGSDPADSIVVQVVTWEALSPEGWGAQYHKTVTFPNGDQSWAQILMIQTLKCDSTTAADQFPCGEWDYIWDTMIKVPRADTTETFSLASFVTPYGKRLDLGGERGWEWTYDVTDYAPFLQGFRNIVTGNNQELLDLKFIFIPGTPVREVLSVENIYPYGSYTYAHLADDSLLTEREIVLNPQAVGYSLKARVSGHGHHGPLNCCEWDSKTHTYFINKYEKFRWNVWKDCGNNPIYPQGGTWPFDRAGWCPGTPVDEYDFELTPLVNPGDTILIDYAIEPYSENGEGEGNFRMSHQLFSYGPITHQLDAAVAEIVVPSSKQQHRRRNPSLGHPQIVIRNDGDIPLQSVVIKYGLLKGKKTRFTWFGYLEFGQEERVYLPVPRWKGLRHDQRFVVSLDAPNGRRDENRANDQRLSRVLLPVTLPNRFSISILTNNLGRARESACILTDAGGSAIYQNADFQDSTRTEIPFNLARGYYEFRFTDQMEDGISRHWWYRNSNPEFIGINGEIQFTAQDSTVLQSFPPDFGEEIRFGFWIGRLP